MGIMDKNMETTKEFEVCASRMPVRENDEFQK